MRSWFTGYALLIPFFFGNAIAQAVFATPSAIASRYSKKAGLTVWLVTLTLLLGAVVVYLNTLNFSPPNGIWRLGIPLAFIVLGPQALAYLLMGSNPVDRILVAFGLGVALAIAWIVGGVLSRATPD
jgi:hypothetical protein